MKVIHFTLDARSGAGIAARRGVEALRMAGVDADLFDAQKLGRSTRWRRWRARLDNLPTRLYPSRRLFTSWSNGWLASGVARRLNEFNADLVHLHWLGHGALSWREISHINAPLMWTFHDAWAFTGGCHYPGDCRKFEADCGRCPQLGSIWSYDLSHWNLRGRQDVLSRVKRIVTPSRWLGELACRSGRVAKETLRVVPNALSSQLLGGECRETIRARRGVMPVEWVFVAGSLALDEPRKGNHLLEGCLGEWRRSHPDARARLVIFGGEAPLRLCVPGVLVEQAGFLMHESQLADLLTAADVLLMPSLQDNLPNIALEAQACGCAVVGFDAGGLAEIVVVGETGSLASERTAEGLGRALAKWTAGPGRYRTVVAELCHRNAVNKFAPDKHAHALQTVYKEVMR